MLAAAYLVRHRPGGRTARVLCDRGYPAADLLPDLLAKVVCSTGTKRRRSWIVLAEYLTVAGALTAVLLFGLSAWGRCLCFAL